MKRGKVQRKNSEIQAALILTEQFVTHCFELPELFPNVVVRREKSIDIDGSVLKLSGGVLTVRKSRNQPSKPLVIAEMFEFSGKKADYVHLLNLIGAVSTLKRNLANEYITPVVCFVWGSALENDEVFKYTTKLATQLNDNCSPNVTWVFKRKNNGVNYRPVSIYIQSEMWTAEEMSNIMNEIAESAFRYWVL